MSPLDMMLARMETLWTAQQYDAALAVARMAAPYVHPRAQPASPQAVSPHSDADVLGWAFAADADDA